MISIKTKNVEFPRGNTHRITFKILDLNNQPMTLGETDRIYFTFKTNWNRLTPYLFQKTMGSGITYEDDEYTILIDAGDTETLDETSYVYDVELQTGTEVMTMFKGTIKLLVKATGNGGVSV